LHWRNARIWTEGIGKLVLRGREAERYEVSVITRVSVTGTYRIGNESVPIQLAQCRFPGLTISIAKILIYFPNKIYGSNFIKQHSETYGLI